VPKTFTPDERRDLIARISALPIKLEALVSPLSPEQLTARPIPSEWSVAQNVHHLADSHMNSFIRLKLILTEDHPPLKPYNQDLWADLPDANNPDIGTSLALLRGLHARWTLLFGQLSEEQWNRGGLHQEYGEVTLQDMVETYARHGEGHLDQIRRALTAQE
jgi:hypothetical protein